MAKAVRTNIEKKILALLLSIGLNLALLGVLFFLNERYKLLSKVERVVFQEGRVPGIAPSYEMNRKYQVRREIFRLDRNEAARVLMLGDSLTAQGEWNAMLGEPLVANRGIDGDTSAGLLARVGDDEDFRGDAMVIWIGTNDVLQGETAGSVVERITQVARRKATLTTTEQREIDCRRQLRRSERSESKGTENAEEEARSTTDKADGHGYLAGLRPGSRAGAAFSNPLTSEFARDSESTLPIRYADDHASSSATSHPLIATAPKVPKIFVLSVPPMARWWEGARERNGTIRDINSTLAASAIEAVFVFVDLQPVLADGDGFLRGDLTSDGVHLNAKGYSVVLEKLKGVAVFSQKKMGESKFH